MSTALLEASRPLVDEGDDRLYEVVDGRRQEKSMGAYEVGLMSLLGLYLGQYSLTHQLGKVVVEMLFNFGTEGQPQRRPDVAFVSFERWPKDRKLPSENAWQVVPDLAVEVVSPTNTANEVEVKVVEYLKAGVRLVWVVHPSTSRVYVHDSSSTVKVVSGAEDLDGGGVLPGFRLSLSTLFGGDLA